MQPIELPRVIVEHEEPAAESARAERDGERGQQESGQRGPGELPEAGHRCRSYGIALTIRGGEC
jgi:hypothetical protein